MGGREVRLLPLTFVNLFHIVLSNQHNHALIQNKMYMKKMRLDDTISIDIKYC
jgi:hypothetical protein